MALTTRAPRRIRLCLAAAVYAGVTPLPACVDLSGLRDSLTHPCGSSGCAVAPQDCASLSSADWAVEGYLTSTETTVSVDASVEISMAPAVEAQCEAFVRSATWRIDDQAVATVSPRGRSAWISGVSPGLTSLGARLSFSDGVTREARARTVRVVPRAAPVGGQLVLDGSVTVAPYIPGSNGTVWSAWVPFTTPAAGRIEVTIDWGSPLNRMDMSGYERHCDSIGSCGRIRMTVRQYGVKPLSATFDDPRTPAGEYTIRIDNLGPAEETVRYVVRLAPS